MIQNSWTDKISNATQLGGIETAVLDNGPGRGTRIAWINTGTGLRFKVVLDRAMDIADAFYNKHSLAWLSHSGITAPQPFSNKGLDWLESRPCRVARCAISAGRRGLFRGQSFESSRRRLVPFACRFHCLHHAHHVGARAQVNDDPARRGINPGVRVHQVGTDECRASPCHS